MTGLPLRLSSSHLLNFCMDGKQGKPGQVLCVGMMRKAQVEKKLCIKLQS